MYTIQSESSFYNSKYNHKPEVVWFYKYSKKRQPLEKKFKKPNNQDVITFNKKIHLENLSDILLGLDSDEGIRIENYEDGTKIFINRNLLGTYSILIRSKKKSDKDDKQYEEQILNYNEVALVLECIKEKADKFNIWLYWFKTTSFHAFAFINI